MKYKNNRIWIFGSVIVLLIVVFISAGGNTIVRRYFKSEINAENKRIDSLENIIAKYKPDSKQARKIDSLNLVIKNLNNYTNEKTRFIYINSDFDNKYKLLTDRISKDTLQ